MATYSPRLAQTKAHRRLVAEISRKLEAPYIVVLLGESLDYGIALVPASVVNQKQFQVPVLPFPLLIYGFRR